MSKTKPIIHPTDRFKATLHKIGKGLHVAQFYEDIYCVKYHVLWPTTGRQMAQYMADEGIRTYEELDEDFVARTYYGPTKRHFTVVFGFGRDSINGNRNYLVECVTHEASHAAIKVLHRAGVKTKPKNDEAFAYYLSMLTRRLMEMLP